MQAYDLDSQNPEGPLRYPPPENWSIPVGRIAGIAIYVSYSVFIALAIVAVLVATIQNRQGQADLPVVASTTVAVWATGWLVQLIVFLGFQSTTFAHSDSLTIGLLGAEVGFPLSRRRCWTAATNVLVAGTCLAALTVLGVGCLAMHLSAKSLDLGTLANWTQTLSTPGFGFGTVENIYLAATWMFWFQAFCQAFPMPRNLGRGGLISLMALFAAEADEEFKRKLARRMIQLLSLVLMLIALSILLVEPTQQVPRWPAIVLLSLLLWQSAGRSDVVAWIRSVEFAKIDQSESAALLLDYPASGSGSFAATRSHGSNLTGSPGLAGSQRAKSPGLVKRATDSFLLYQKRKRARLALQRERSEAFDISRLDEVLQIVSEKGKAALSSEDLALLERVSEMLRKNRQSAEATDGLSNQTDGQS
ncbi:hypothetical protein [Rhodopirellula sp. MGV]|uniref:hypothetical protein n=1 Tax=Rhodopirellula sp. MGV TaxID=2023130 RepID=UPI000B96195A|nr:hypothetical protein [Rhodopirellula sp. MGV]OYP31123.1 hypothetical protein CGZ80_21245 [Rhodopirellula sp. MGV]PNY36053.1 hypothetical protein C2E31_15180 [Rhodopirellula baltica]